MKVVVVGAGVCGLTAAMLLARDGHGVTVLERDDQPVPDSPEQAWGGWKRGGVAQFRQAHYLTPRGWAVLAAELPDVAAAFEAAGAVPFDLLSLMPPSITDRGPRPGDERLATVTGRRPTLEHVVARAAQDEPGVEIRRGTSVAELTLRDLDGTPHVTGVRTAAGETLGADLVVDAMGRGSRLPRWLRDAGVAPIHEESEDSGFIYYTQFFRAADGGGVPQARMPLVTPIGSISVLTLPGDNATWSVTLYISSGDQPLKRLRHADRFHAVVAACPMHAHWLDGEPITDVEAMAGVVDRYRRIAVDGRPVVTGVALLADAWACTNPSIGRGITLGLLHAQRLRDVLREHGEHPREFAEAWDAVTEAELTPWYRDTIGEDRARLREIEALRAGVVPGPPSTPEAQLRAALMTAIPHDPEVFRAFLASRAVVRTLRESLGEPGFAEHVFQAAAGKEPRPLPGPSRDALLQLAAA